MAKQRPTKSIDSVKGKGKSKVTADTVFQYLRLSTVRLVNVDAKLSIIDSKLPVHADIKLLPSAGPTPNGDRINANLQLELVGRPEEKSGDDCSNVKVNALYQCVYEVHGVDIDEVTPHGVQIANIAVLVAWPYMRELCNSLTSRMGIPGFTLPMYTPAQATGQAPAESKARKGQSKKS